MNTRSSLQIEPTRPRNLPDIAALAGLIWRKHYPGIISLAQIEYMLATMYDFEVMRQELERGITWLQAVDDGRLCGFASAGPSAPKEFKLHKLYVHPERQREGIGAALLKRIESIARAHSASRLVLNVNKRNEIAITAYRKHGFTIRESVVVDIGGGFVMDDYVMVKTLEPGA